MSIKDNVNLMSSEQVKRRLKSIDTDKIDIKHNLLNFVEQFQCLDHIAKSMGVLKEGVSFVNRVSWDAFLSKLEMKDISETEEIKFTDISETLLLSSNQLENELVPKLQHLRNNWMLEVILIEFVFFILLILTAAGITHTQGVWSLSNISFSIQPFLYERPIFSLLSGTLLFISFVWGHFSIRHFVANRFVRKINKEKTEFDLAGAFLKNTRLQHSIFRPEIIGWNWFSRKCLLKNKV